MGYSLWGRKELDTTERLSLFAGYIFLRFKKSVHPSIHPPPIVSLIHPSIHLSTCLPTHTPIHPSIHPSNHPFLTVCKVPDLIFRYLIQKMSDVCPLPLSKYTPLGKTDKETVSIPLW